MPKPLDLRARNREYDARRTQEQPWRAWYNTTRWRRLRKYQLTSEPHCRMCATRGQLTRATVCDHVLPHRGREDIFWNGPFQSLCAECHNRDKQAIEKGGRPRQIL